MEIPEAMAKLKAGDIPAWNAWHREQLLLPKVGKGYIHLIKPDFRGADLRGVNFERIGFVWGNLQGANLSGTNFYNTDVRFADFSGANLSGADLHYIRCAGAKFTGANFSGADLSWTSDLGGDLSRANFTGANLSWTNFFDTNLKDANFARAVLFETSFDGACMDGTVLTDVDLSHARGLDQVCHRGPSLVDVNTILKSRDRIPEEFLRSCGLSDEFIRNIPSLIFDLEPADSCMVYYWNPDNEFARRLCSSLWEAKARCGLFETDLITQYKCQIKPGLKGYDRLILVLSRHRQDDKWLEPLVKKALKREIKWKRQVLFPVQLDDSELKIETGWAASMFYTRPCIDFRNWKNPKEYQHALDDLMRSMGIRRR